MLENSFEVKLDKIIELLEKITGDTEKQNRTVEIKRKKNNSVVTMPITSYCGEIPTWSSPSILEPAPWYIYSPQYVKFNYEAYNCTVTDLNSVNTKYITSTMDLEVK